MKEYLINLFVVRFISLLYVINIYGGITYGMKIDIPIPMINGISMDEGKIHIYCHSNRS